MKRIIKKVQGITLIALVVTIVVLLILAAVTINMAVNNNGLFARAKNSTAAYQAAQANESEGMNGLEDIIDKEGKASGGNGGETTVAESKTKGTLATENTKLTDDGGNTVWLPGGFTVVSDSPTKASEGLVISDVAGDDLANSKGGNQYVWIPCTIDGANGSIKYDRYAFTRTGWSYNQTKTGDIITENNYSGNFTETIDAVEQTSVTKYGGFYIGRYEAGDGVSTTAKTLRTSSTSKTNLVTVKKAQAPYNYVTRDEAKTLAEGIKSTNNYTGITASKLCSSYAWDTALIFIDTVKSGYSTNTTTNTTANTTDNCYDTTFTYKDLAGASQTKAASSSTLVPTGVTTPVANIYDLGGNEAEWTTEAYSKSYGPCVDRGGNFVGTSSDFPAGFRNGISTSFSFDSFGFRPTLYL